MRILAVDDDESILDILEALLSDDDENAVERASDGFEALRKLSDNPEQFECILLDIQMPRMDGISVCEEIRKIPDYHYTPIVMVTAMSDRRYLDRAFRAGANDYITKPLDATEFMARIRVVRDLVEERQLSLMQARMIEELTDQVTNKSGIDMETVLAVGATGGLIDYPWFENYLLQLGRADALGSGLLIFGISNIADIEDRADGQELAHIIGDLSECVAEILAGQWFVQSYCGGGVFVVAVDSVGYGMRNRFIELLRMQIDSYNIIYTNGTPVRPDIQPGTFFRLSIMSNKRTLEALHSAVDEMRQRLKILHATG